MFRRPQGIAFENLSREAFGSLLTALRPAPPRNIIKAVLQVGSKLPHSPKSATLGASLVLSAWLTASALRLPDQHWLAWISFLPLFVVVRSLRPPVAALAGALWGGCLYLFCTAGPAPVVDTVAPAISPSASLLALLIVISAVYVGLAARRVQAIGFKLLTLALGWTLIEVVFHIHSPSGAREGLLPGSAGAIPQVHWLARLLGYVCAAFLVACVNASLVGILSGVRLCFPVCRSLAGSPNLVGPLASQIVLPIQSWTLRQAHPRAPPIPLATVS